MILTVNFCCNDDRGDFAGRVIEIQIGEECRLYCKRERGSKMQREPGLGVRVGRTWFHACPVVTTRAQE